MTTSNLNSESKPAHDPIGAGQGHPTGFPAERHTCNGGLRRGIPAAARRFPFDQDPPVESATTICRVGTTAVSAAIEEATC